MEKEEQGYRVFYVKDNDKWTVTKIVNHEICEITCRKMFITICPLTAENVKVF